MTTTLETIRRLHAWRQGKAIPRGEVVNVHITEDKDLMVMAFLRMGGESRPWGIAIGTLADGPRFLTVPEARNRNLVGDMMVEVAEILLRHFDHPEFSEVGPTDYRNSIRQVWLPGLTHVEMLQNLAAAYARSRWDRPNIETLRSFGNLCNALFIEYQRPGQQTVMSATESLRECYVFPAASIRQGHLGHLLGWLTSVGTREERLDVAHAAEQNSVSTVLNPEYEREVLQPLVEKWGEAQKSNNIGQMQQIEKKIHDALVVALKLRWESTVAAIRHIDDDVREYNTALSVLAADSMKSMHRTWGERAIREAAGEIAYWPNVFGDNNTRVAGREYQKRNAYAEKARHLLVHGDRELQREELAAGHGVICKVTSVEGRWGNWVATWSYPDLPTLKETDNLVIAGAPSFELTVSDIDIDSKTLYLSPGWARERTINGRQLFKKDDSRWKGTDVVLLKKDAHGLSERKAVTTGKIFGDDDIVNLIGSASRRHAAYDSEGRVEVDAQEEVGAG